MQVFAHNGTLLGNVKRSDLAKHMRSWAKGFYAFDGKRVVLSPRASLHEHGKESLLVELDQAYAKYRNNKVELEREKIAKQRALDEERERADRRLGMVELSLEGRSDECRSYVMGLMTPEESREVSSLVESELKAHPELYVGIQSYEHIRLATLALANSYDRDHSEDMDDLLARAHLFMFDDEAWWESRGCSDELTCLPYQVCLVEDVLIWDVGNGIRSLALSPSADEGASRRMLSFIVNRCSSRKLRDGTVAFSKTMDALPGAIAVSSLRSGTLPTVQRGAKTSSKQGRSPRRHTRRGHWRNQAYGPGMKLHKRIWISDTVVGPSGKAYKVTEPTRIHFVSFSKANER